MPNWCYNEITIISPTKNVHKAILKDVAYDREGKKKDLELESWLEDYMLGTVRYIPTFQKLTPCKTKDGEYTSPGL